MVCSRRPVLPNEQPTQPPRAAAPQFGVPAGDAAAAAQPPNRSAGGAGAASPGNQGQDVPFVDPEDAAIRQAQVNLARNLGREAFTSLFPGIPFPPEAENPRDSGSGGRANSSATEPTLTAQRSSSLLPPPASAAGSGDSPSGLGVRAAPLPATGTGDNPLARFSLPELPVPSAGEASLFQEPPSFVYASPNASTSSTYSNLAYGAYPRTGGGGGGTNYPASPFASVQQPPNIIERLETVRRRWTAQETPPNASAAGSSDASPPQDSTSAAPASEAESSVSAFTAEEKGKSKEVVEDSTAAAAIEEDISPREAALRAAERRLGRTQQSEDNATGPVSSAASLPPGSAVSATTDAEVAERPPDHGAGGTKGRSETALPTPRLIPLFDPAHPTPFVGETRAWTPIELEGAVTKTLEDKLRTLAEFQERLDSLIGDLRTAMGT